MRITEHPSIRQTGEHLDSNQRLFAPTVILDGAYSLEELRDVVRNDLLPLVMDDMQAGEYRAVFLDPKRVEAGDGAHDRMRERAIAESFGQKGTIHYVDRDQSDYGGHFLHTHPKVCTSSLCTRSGNTPTMLVTDEREILERLSSPEVALASLAGEESVDLVRSARDDPDHYARDIAAHICRVLFYQKFGGSRGEEYRINRRIQQEIKNIDGKVLRAQRTGAISIFTSDVLHAADAPDDQPATGELLVEFFANQRKAEEFFA